MVLQIVVLLYKVPESDAVFVRYELDFAVVSWNIDKVGRLAVAVQVVAVDIAPA